MRRRLDAKIVGKCECSGAIVMWIRGAVATDTLAPMHLVRPARKKKQGGA